jgi:hypothetical protein
VGGLPARDYVLESERSIEERGVPLVVVVVDGLVYTYLYLLLPPSPLPL